MTFHMFPQKPDQILDLDPDPQWLKSGITTLILGFFWLPELNKRYLPNKQKLWKQNRCKMEKKILEMQKTNGYIGVCRGG